MIETGLQRIHTLKFEEIAEEEENLSSSKEGENDSRERFSGKITSDTE